MILGIQPEDAVAPEGLKILMVTSEAVPFAKAGGLADMVSALATELHRLGHDVRMVLPRYYSVDIARLMRIGQPLGVPLGGGEEWCAVYSSRLPAAEVPVYFLDHERLFGRDGIYGLPSEPGFEDNLSRFALLCRGAFQLCRALRWVPDVIHSHDWPAALAPVFLNTIERDEPFHDTVSVLTIHNLAYQGVFPQDDLADLPLEPGSIEAASLRGKEGINLLQAGILNADLLTTVSPTYADEILTREEGCGLDGLLRRRRSDLVGVLNGMDYEMWNPETDDLIAATYSVDDLDGKAVNKEALQERMGLEVDPEVPLFAMVSRLVDQKGFGQLCGPAHGSLYSICADFELQFVILGTGDRWCEDELRVLDEQLPNLAVEIGFNNRLAHLIEAGADFFLMPSAFEPCGLNQMYSLRYGTLPIVRRTGGLADTVVNHDGSTGGGTGFVFSELTPRAIYDTVGWALWTWYNRPEHIEAMQRRAMAARFSWSDSADRYVELYRRAIDRRRGRPSTSAG
jgi:starch synthase